MASLRQRSPSTGQDSGNDSLVDAVDRRAREPRTNPRAFGRRLGQNDVAMSVTPSAGRIIGAGLVSLGATLPIEFARSHGEPVEDLATAPARTDFVDAARSAATVTASGSSDADAHLAVDGHDETAWVGREGASEWTWSMVFDVPVHLGAIRAHFGESPSRGVPTTFLWAIRHPSSGACSELADSWAPLDDAGQDLSPTQSLAAQPTRRTWFVDTEACGLRLLVQRTNGGPPVMRELRAIESASNVLRGAAASDDGSFPGFDAFGAIDGTYSRRWAGAPGKETWTLRLDLPEIVSIDRVRLVLGFDATTTARAVRGRQYAIAWGPVRYALEASEDGERFSTVATEPRRVDGAIMPLRRRLVTLDRERRVRALRLIIRGATDGHGLESADAVPVVREISAYRSDDTRPVMSPPWILSVNANPTGQLRTELNGEVANDAFYAKFLQRRLGFLVPAMRRDDRFARSLDEQGTWHDAPPGESAGAVLEAIEGDDPQLDARFLAESSPPPIAVLSGSNDWDYAETTGPDPEHPKRWFWNPLLDARDGGMGNLGEAVRHRLAPFLGFCGGAQILGLLEASPDGVSAREDPHLIDLVLRRAAGSPIRGFAPLVDVERSWPDDPRPSHTKIEFAPDDTLFADVWSVHRRPATLELPESHADALRPDAFLWRAPLHRYEVVARSSFCGKDVTPGGPEDRAFANPDGPGKCVLVPEAFRSRDPAWPIIGTQFHVEQRDFANAGAGDPPESVSDPRLFLAAAFEVLADAYLKYGR